MVGSLGQIAVCQPSLCLVTEGVELGTNIREDYTIMENGGNYGLLLFEGTYTITFTFKTLC